MAITLPNAADIPAQHVFSGCADSRLTPRDYAYIEMDESGVVKVEWLTEYGGDGIPFDVWHKRTLRYRLPAGVDRAALVDQLAEGGEVSALLARVHAGHTVEWDGSNYVGCFDDDAAEADEDNISLLADLPRSDFEVWDASEWLYGRDHTAASMLEALSVPLDATEEQITAAAEEQAENAARNNAHILGGAGALAEVIREAIEEVHADDEA